MALITKTQQAGDFFKAKDHLGAKAFLIEPKDILRDQPNGNFPGTRDVVVADVTVFEDDAALNGASAPTVLRRAQIVGKGLTGDLEDYLGEQLAFGIKLKPSKTPGYQPFPVWVELDVSITERIEAWINDREASVKADLASGIPDDLFA